MLVIIISLVKLNKQGQTGRIEPVDQRSSKSVASMAANRFMLHKNKVVYCIVVAVLMI